MSNEIEHPLAEGTEVRASKPSCPCKNPTYKNIIGRITKVIEHPTSGVWYYLDSNHTIRAQWVIELIV